MNSLITNNLGVYETMWTNNVDFVSEKYRLNYEGREKNESGVGLILGQYTYKCVLRYCQLSE